MDHVMVSERNILTSENSLLISPQLMIQFQPTYEKAMCLSFLILQWKEKKKTSFGTEVDLETCCEALVKQGVVKQRIVK